MNHTVLGICLKEIHGLHILKIILHRPLIVITKTFPL